jgi:very-short-patch-repair endonuclease
MEDGSEHAKQHDDENDDQRNAFVREHGGLLL